MPQAVLDVRGLGKTWDDGRRRIDITVDRLRLLPGEFKAIVGPSGSGKSTALDLLALVRKPDRADSVCLRQGREETAENITTDVMSGQEERLCALRRGTFSYVVQTSELMPFLRLREDIALQQQISGRGSMAFARSLAERLDIGDCMELYPSDLSVGQRQRGAIVRAAAVRPDILLADEPTSALDPDLKNDVIDAFKDTAGEGSAILMVTHDLELIDKNQILTVGIETQRSGAGWTTVFSDGTE